MIHPNSSRKVQWTCNQCPAGARHVWQAVVSNRTAGKGCPYCTGKAVCQHNSLATQAPNVASEWDSDVNSLTPSDFTSHSNVMVGWKCSTCQHTWLAIINSRTYGSGCPQCAILKRAIQNKQPTLAASGPTVMKFWDAEQNAQHGFHATRLTLGSCKKVHWVCHECPAGQKHRWRTSPNARHLGRKTQVGCPFCANRKACKCNSLQTLCPDLAAEWDYQRNNTTPSDHVASSCKTVFWMNSKRGSWQQTLHGRSSNEWLRKRRALTNRIVLPGNRDGLSSPQRCE